VSAFTGDVAYISPEQAEGVAPDERSDIFSFGAVLYEMLTGQRVFRGNTTFSVLSSVLHENPKPLDRGRTRVPRSVEKIIMRCLRKDPKERWQKMGSVKVALEDVLPDSGIPAEARSTAALTRRIHFFVGLPLVIVALAAGVFIFGPSVSQPTF